MAIPGESEVDRKDVRVEKMAEPVEELRVDPALDGEANLAESAEMGTEEKVDELKREFNDFPEKDEVPPDILENTGGDTEKTKEQELALGKARQEVQKLRKEYWGSGKISEKETRRRAKEIVDKENEIYRLETPELDAGRMAEKEIQGAQSFEELYTILKSHNAGGVADKIKRMAERDNEFGDPNFGAQLNYESIGGVSVSDALSITAERLYNKSQRNIFNPLTWGRYF